MRVLSKPSTATCTLPIYVSYLLGEPKRASCVRLGESLSISHDSVTRMLGRENYTPKDLFVEIMGSIVLSGGTLSVDDTVLDKPYSKLIPFVKRFWSGKHHCTVVGANLITLFYTDINGVQVPVNFRLYDSDDKKTKNDYFRDMVTEVLLWGLNPSWITGDSWYSGIENLNFIKNNDMGFFFAVKTNRTILSIQNNKVAVAYLDIAEQSGAEVYLPKFGHVTVYRMRFKNEVCHYVAYAQNQEQGIPLPTSIFETLHSHHYSIEQYHRILLICALVRRQCAKWRSASCRDPHFSACPLTNAQISKTGMSHRALFSADEGSHFQSCLLLYLCLCAIRNG